MNNSKLRSAVLSGEQLLSNVAYKFQVRPLDMMDILGDCDTKFPGDLL